MNYELKSSIKRNRLGLPFKVVIIVIALLVILRFILPNLLNNILMTFVRPVWIIGRDSSVNIPMLLPETQNAIIAELKKENSELKAMFNRTSNTDLVLGYILKKPPYTVYDSYIIDIGSQHGVSVGDKVYVSGDILVGDIQEVSNNSSKVRLFSSYGTKFDILISDKNVEAIATGGGGGSFLTVVPRDLKIKEGDIITVPDISNSVFGRVGKVIVDPARAFSTVIFSQSINLYEQKWVLVSINKNK